MTLRFDTYRIDRKAVRHDTTGFLKVPVYATRTGVFSYRTKNGTIRRELRHPDEVFKVDSLQTLAGVAFTNKHPSELVNSNNVRKYIVGSVSDNVGRHDDIDAGISYVDTSVTIMDEKMIEQVEKKGLREVSCGYKCDVVEEAGVYNGEHYDHVQKNIRYNHLAGVERGRAGANVRLRMDSDAELVEDSASDPSPINNTHGGIVMRITIDGVEYEVADNTLASAITNALTKRDSAIADHEKQIVAVKADAKKENDTLQAKYDGLKEDHDKLKERNDSLDVRSLVKGRVALEKVASKHLDSESLEKIDSMDDKEIKIAVIQSKYDGFDAEGKSDDYLAARFDSIVESTEGDDNNGDDNKGNKKLDNALGRVDQNRADSDKVKSLEEIRQDNMRESENAWQKPLGNRAANGGN